MLNHTEILETIKGGDNIIYGINKYISPKYDAKFSPNLYKFLTYKNRPFTNVFQDPITGYYYIGLRQKNGNWMGTHLMSVFCLGNKAKLFSYSVSVSVEWNDVTTWFYKNYFINGKALYDMPVWRKIQTEINKKC